MIDSLIYTQGGLSVSKRPAMPFFFFYFHVQGIPPLSPPRQAERARDEIVCCSPHRDRFETKQSMAGPDLLWDTRCPRKRSSVSLGIDQSIERRGAVQTRGLAALFLSRRDFFFFLEANVFCNFVGTSHPCSQRQHNHKGKAHASPNRTIGTRRRLYIPLDRSSSLSISLSQVSYFSYVVGGLAGSFSGEIQVANLFSTPSLGDLPSSLRPTPQENQIL